MRIIKQSSLSKEYYDEYLQNVKDIEAKGEAKGRVEGAEQNLIENIKSVMKNLNIPLSEIAKLVNLSEAQVKEYLTT